MKTNVLSSLALIASALLPLPFAAGIKPPMRHDASWEPEYVLVATAENITINCQSRYSTVFNGTSPGPTIHLQEGKTTWVRVWNRIENDNVTVVSNQLQTQFFRHPMLITVLSALARSHPESRALRRWYPIHFPMADCTQPIL